MEAEVGSSYHSFDEWPMISNDIRTGLNLEPSLRQRLENVRRNLRRAEDQLVRWREVPEKPSVICRRSKSAEDARNLRLVCENRSLDDDPNRSQAKDRNEREVYAKCLVIAEQQLAEMMKNKYDGDQHQLHRRLMQIDEEVQQVEGILNKKRHCKEEVNFAKQIGSDSSISYDQNWDDPVFPHQHTREGSEELFRAMEREMKYWRSSAQQHWHEWQRERTDMHRRIKILQEQIGRMKKFRRHAQFDESKREAENFQLKNERDALTITLYKINIQQMASKLKLEKTCEDMNGLVKHIAMVDLDMMKKRLLLRMATQMLHDLERIQMDISTSPRSKEMPNTGQKATKSLLSSLKEVSMDGSVSNVQAKHSSLRRPAIQQDAVQDVKKLNSSNESGFGRVRNGRSLSADDRRKLTVSWGGCIVFDEEEEPTMKPILSMPSSPSSDDSEDVEFDHQEITGEDDTMKNDKYDESDL